MVGYLLAAAILFCIQGWSSGRANEIPYTELFRRSSCHPREMLVNILKEHPGEIAYIFKPPCVVLQRCAGCCNDSSMKCFSVTKRSIRLLLLRVNPKTQTSQMKHVSFTEHVTCECRSRRNSGKKRKRSPAQGEPRDRLPFT